MTDFNIALAEIRTRSFADSVMQDHYAAMECDDLDQMLMKGINALKCVMAVEHILRGADQEGLLDLSIEMEAQLCELYVMWHTPVSNVREFIGRVQRNGFTLDNLKSFNRMVELAEEKISENEIISAGRATLFNSLGSEP